MTKSKINVAKYELEEIRATVGSYDVANRILYGLVEDNTNIREHQLKELRAAVIGYTDSENLIDKLLRNIGEIK